MSRCKQLINGGYKILFLTLFLCFALSPLFAADKSAATTFAEDTLPTVSENSEHVFEKVDVEASFAGGLDSWREFLMTNLDGDVPVRKKAPAGIYTVIAVFIVSKDGTVSDIRALTKHGFGMEEEVIRILRKSPRWNPARQNGRAVKAYRKQPVSFQIIDDRKKKKGF